MGQSDTMDFLRCGYTHRARNTCAKSHEAYMMNLSPTLAFFVANPKWNWWYSGIMFAGILTFFVVDRDPPAAVGVQTSVPEVYAGQEVHMNLPVSRDLSRNCTMKVTRELMDSQQQKRIIVTEQQVSPEGFKERQKLSPGALKIVIPVPVTTPSGVAHILTSTRWSCNRNPTTWDWAFPITADYDWLFYVKPPENTPATTAPTS